MARICWANPRMTAAKSGLFEKNLFDLKMEVRKLRYEKNVNQIASGVEREVKSILPNARVTVHTEPVGGNRRNIWRLVKDVAEEVSGSGGVHNTHPRDRWKNMPRHSS